MKKRIFLFTFFPLIILYFITGSSTVYWQDSGLYLSGVKTLGIIYPPGNPLYLMLVFIWTKLLYVIPLGVSFTKIVISFSGFWGALSSFMVAITVFEILVWFAKTELKVNRKAVIPKVQTAAVISTIVGILSGVSYSLWSQAINAEVYSMISFFVACIFYLLIKIIIILSNASALKGKEINRLILLIIILFGLSISVHPLVILTTPVLVIFGLMYKERLQKYLSTKNILIYIIVAIFSVLIPILYLPIRAHFNPDFMWSRIGNLKDLINYLLSKQYFTGEESLVLLNFQRISSYPILLVSELNLLGITVFLLGVFELTK